MFNVVNLYKTHRMKDSLYSHPDIKDTQFKDLEEYSELLLKQFSPRLEELLKQSTSQKIALEKLQKEFASKPT